MVGMYLYIAGLLVQKYTEIYTAILWTQLCWFFITAHFLIHNLKCARRNITQTYMRMLYRNVLAAHIFCLFFSQNISYQYPRLANKLSA